ncbi:hypothetical protein [Actinosynnema pretiosum]|uniref:Uncharacterized protein n=1 Tax=Actinosynnema pretiosum TaxID=42197 RepID=A0A290Z3T7_9PSEU|nr:hypothetical protein [Actinosynnema pretiosum]ATE53613.1 hypothetical protein CNX65_10180 [Actinosynnema pretiosum]
MHTNGNRLATVLVDTARSCRYGCGLTKVLVDHGAGRRVRVHCGTGREACPGRTAIPAQRHAGFVHPVGALAA